MTAGPAICFLIRRGRIRQRDRKLHDRAEIKDVVTQGRAGELIDLKALGRKAVQLGLEFGHAVFTDDFVAVSSHECSVRAGAGVASGILAAGADDFPGAFGEVRKKLEYRTVLFDVAGERRHQRTADDLIDINEQT